MKNRSDYHLSFAISSFLTLFLALGATHAQAYTETTQEEEKSPSSQDPVLQQLEELRNMIRALQSEMSELRKAVNDIHRVAVRPRTPPAPSSVDLDDDDVMGSTDAKVAIVEFSDYQCPYCKRYYQQTFPQIKETYIDTGKVQYIFRDFPLEQIHNEAVPAAVVANCAGQQGKYWEMHRALFSHQGRFAPDVFTELARNLELDLDTFQTCLQEPAQKQEVSKDLTYGQSVGVRGTPHFFVGRVDGGKLVDVKALSGAQPFPSFQSLIDALLQ